MANRLTIAVLAASETNEDQARLLIDGKDWLGPEVAGLDPPMLAAELLGKRVGTLIVGRCWCGIMGCNDVKVEVIRNKSYVHWSVPDATSFSFVAAQYDAEVARFAQDRSWESLERTAAREIEHILRGTTIRGGFEFEWASTRERDGLVRLAFRKGRRQRFLKFRWDGASVEDAINRARLFRAERLSHCD
ncbi:MAG TPA: hypothetical protein VEA60_12535 [Allosphingosinicella sp.]|nr:hypothetical protein [Allosphingosinicella sp.]